jgi:hypothetical protein
MRACVFIGWMYIDSNIVSWEVTEELKMPDIK